MAWRIPSIRCERIGNCPEAVAIGMEPADYLTMDTEMIDACKEKFPKFLRHLPGERESVGVEVVEKGTGAVSWAGKAGFSAWVFIIEAIVK